MVSIYRWWPIGRCDNMAETVGDRPPSLQRYRGRYQSKNTEKTNEEEAIKASMWVNGCMV